MKQSVTTILFAVLMSMTGVNAFAYNIAVKNRDGVTIYYSWKNNKTELTVSHVVDGFVESNFWDYYDDNDCWYSGNVVIPESVEYDGKEYRVTSIGEYAFFLCNVTSVTIPNSVTSIGDFAFSYCSGLLSVTIPNSVTSIGDDAFKYCSGLTSVSIPNSVTSIGDDAFKYCSGLTSITIPKSVTSIGGGAFWNCSGLTSIEVESGNMNYDSRNNCNAIIDNNNQLILGCKNTIIPNSVTSIGDYAFYNCSGLVYIILPPNVVSIGYNAFDGCNGLTDIYCKAKNVPSASSDAFSNPENITLYVPNESFYAYKSTEPWDKFGSYVSLYDSDLQASEKCSKPTISIVDGRSVLSCETPDVNYHWSISTPSGTKGNYYSSSTITLNNSIIFNVFATKSGYLPSDVTTYEFLGLVGDVDGNGIVNVADHVKLSEIIMEQKK